MAQDTNEDQRGPDRGTSVHVHGVQVLPATAKPFSGRDHIEWTRKLEDGSVITSELYAFVARDSQGRIYREHVSFVPANSSRPSGRAEIDFFDPVAHTQTICIVAKRRCTIGNYHASAKFIPPPVGPQANGTRYLAREPLGSDEIDGLPVTGSRETLTINAGVLGNASPLVTTKDYWYSPDLEINLLTTRKDPRVGTQVIQVVDLSRTKPDPQTFQPPAGFIIHDARSSIPSSAGSPTAAPGIARNPDLSCAALRHAQS